MSETVAIILSFREAEADRFEALFEAEVYPLWQEFKANGRMLAASLTPVLDGSHDEMKAGMRKYILHVEVPGRGDHNAFDTDPRFKQFLEKALPLQPEEAKVWLGNTLFQV